MSFAMLSMLLIALVMVLGGVAVLRLASSGFPSGEEVQASATTTSTTIGARGLEATASSNFFRYSSSHQSIWNVKSLGRRLLHTSARATFYTDYSETACFGSNHQEFGAHKYIVALKKGLYESSKCGQCILVTCVGGTQGDGYPCHSEHNHVYVKVADECSGSRPCDGELDLSSEAFNYIAKPEEGIIKVTYSFVNDSFC